MNTEITEAVNNLIAVFKEHTKDMNGQSLTVLISVDTNDCTVEHQDGDKCQSTKNLIASQGRPEEITRLILTALQKVFEESNSSSFKENKILGLIKASAQGEEMVQRIKKMVQDTIFNNIKS